jgi:hypothetical protein
MNVTDTRPEVLRALESYNTLNTKEKTTHILVRRGSCWSVERKPTGFRSWFAGLFESKAERTERVSRLLNKLLEDLTYTNTNKSDSFPLSENIKNAVTKILNKTHKHTNADFRTSLQAEVNKLAEKPQMRADKKQVPSPPSKTKCKERPELPAETLPNFSLPLNLPGLTKVAHEVPANGKKGVDNLHRFSSTS